MLRWDLFETLLERWKLEFFCGEVGTHRAKVSVSAARKAEKGTCHVGTFCVAGGERWKLSQILG